VGAPVVSNTARIFPARSATATTIGEFTESTAFCTTVVTSAAVSGTTAGGGGSDCLEDEPPPPHDRHNKTPVQTAAQISNESPERPKRQFFLVLIFIILDTNSARNGKILDYRVPFIMPPLETKSSDACCNVKSCDRSYAPPDSDCTKQLQFWRRKWIWRKHRCL